MASLYIISWPARKNTALRKFPVSVHLMTPVDREGIISKKICGNFYFTPLLKSDNFKKFTSYHRTHHSNTQFKSNTCYLLLASGMESRLQLLGNSVYKNFPTW